jgi:ABC-type multidrug transport system fused ATPase/permease subunit
LLVRACAALGRILNRVSKDLDQLDTLLPVTLFGFAQNVSILLGVVAVCMAGSYYMIALFLPIVLIFAFVQRYFRNSQLELKRIENTTRSPIFSLFSETLQGLSVIRAYGVEDDFKRRNLQVVETNSKVFEILCQSHAGWGARIHSAVDNALIIVVGLALLLSLSVQGSPNAGSRCVWTGHRFSSSSLCVCSSPVCAAPFRRPSLLWHLYTVSSQLVCCS